MREAASDSAFSTCGGAGARLGWMKRGNVSRSCIVLVRVGCVRVDIEEGQDYAYALDIEN